MSYYELLARIHGHLRPRTYLEIGVHHGDSLALASPDTIAIGVDPAAEVTVPLPARARVVEATSDEFFSGRDVAAEFGGLPIELAFIDGLHLFEQALRDFLNIERHAAPGATVLVHDCLPIDELTSSRDRQTVIWSGDVWKMVLCLHRYRPDLAIATVDVAPTGLAVIRGLDPAPPGLHPGLWRESTHIKALSRHKPSVEQIFQELVGLGYGDLVAMGVDRTLNRVDNDWTLIMGLLGSPGTQEADPTGRAGSL